MSPPTTSRLRITAGSVVQEKLPVAPADQMARFSDQPVRMSALPRPFPRGTGKRTVPREHKAKRDVTRRCTGIKRVTYGE